MRIRLTLTFVFLCSLATWSQTTVAPFVNALPQFLNSGGTPCTGCQLSTFQAGTSTPLAAYQDSTGTTLHSNPIVMNTAGRPPANIYTQGQSYKFVMKDSNNQTLWTSDNVSWVSPLTTFSGITSTGNTIVKPAVAATGGANQSSPNFSVCGFYFNVTSLQDCWTFTDVLGTGTSPTSTFNLTHSGSAGTAQINFSPALTFSALTATGNLTVGGNAAITGTLGVTGASTLGTLNAGATSVTSMVNTGDESLSSGKVIKWNSDTGISRALAGTFAFGNGTQGDITGNLKGSSFIGTGTGVTSTGAAVQAVSSILPFMAWDITTGLPDSHWWDCGVQSATVFRCAAVSDAGSATNWVTVNRGAGSNLSSIAFGAPIVSPQINTGISSLSTGIQMKRVTTGSVGATSRADVTVTWTTTFADTNYTATCFVVETSAAGLGVRVERIRTQSAGSMIVQAANDAAGALTGTLHCIAIHD